MCPPGKPQPPQEPRAECGEQPHGREKVARGSPLEEEEQEAWVNALLGRIFWDFLGEKYWSDLVSKKIQMKLSKIKLPYFMNELTLTELDMGVAVPKSCRPLSLMLITKASGSIWKCPTMGPF